MRRGCEHHEVARAVLDQTLEQFVALVAAGSGGGAGVCLIHDDQLRTGPQEFGAALLALDVVEADDGVRMGGEDAFAGRKAPFKASGAGGGDCHGMKVEAALQFTDPLVHEMWRAQHGEALDIAAVDQFAGDERGLDGLSDTNIIRDQQAHRFLLQSHQERYELVSPRLDGDLAKASERTGAPAKRQHKRVAQEQRGVMAGLLARLRSGERGVGDRFDFEFEVDERLVLLRAGDRTDSQYLGIAARQDDPFPPTGAHKTAGSPVGGSYGGRYHGRRAQAGLPSKRARTVVESCHAEALEPSTTNSKPLFDNAAVTVSPGAARTAAT